MAEAEDLTMKAKAKAKAKDLSLECHTVLKAPWGQEHVLEDSNSELRYLQ